MLVGCGDSLSSLVDALPKTWQSPTLGVFCADEEKYRVVDDVVRLYEQDQQKGIVIAGQRIKELVTVNGVRFVLNDDSWGLVRASSNKPSSKWNRDDWSTSKNSKDVQVSICVM
jgi:phosphomannomutase/phosphoglucomutase